ncbi:MAG: hypothetical protein K2Q01_08195, partial [Rickettsiales bacterium]|nr:hypothetical protein [Rickettsiales bacterium]
MSEALFPRLPFLKRLSLIRWPLWRAFLKRFSHSRGRLITLMALGAVQSLLFLPMLHLVRYCFDVAIPEKQADTLLLLGVAIFAIRLVSAALVLVTRLISVRLA